jgi:hypothetical protein
LEYKEEVGKGLGKRECNGGRWRKWRWERTWNVGRGGGGGVRSMKYQQ